MSGSLRLMRHMLALALCSAACARGDGRRFVGGRVLLIRPEHSWGWVSALRGALEHKGMDVTTGEPPALEDAKALGQFELAEASDNGWNDGFYRGEVRVYLLHH